MIEPQAISSLSALADQLAMELVFAEADSDNGLLPINSFLTQMEELPNLPSPLTDLIARARRLIDQIFLSSAQFTRESIKSLNLWATELQAAILTLKNGGTLPSNSIPTTKLQSDTSLRLNLPTDHELLKEFASESREHLQNIETGVLVLEESPNDTETLNSIFRAFHTFKGGSGFLNLAPINKLAHDLETLLDRARQQKIAITHPVIELILSSGDALKQFIDSIELQLTGGAPQSPIVIPTDHLHARIASLLSEDQFSAKNAKTQSKILPLGEGRGEGPSST